ncbi:MAG: TAXI family TRAP transporter solute-binding subunit [Syntrophorhabdaceae bacterium]|nr:TAXI family TRAP transporter solute-binding subunit [Syntrophorhabdaceae bacterium]MDD5244175.1 TAXI family TRAP transporter solute-binding subunit [Syntrophorhabdaceae bacterium]
MRKALVLLVTLAIVFLGIQHADAQQKQRLTIATGGTGGVYYPYGGTLAEIINKKVPNVNATAEVTGASVENVRLIGKMDATFGLAMNDTVYQAYAGEGKFTGKKIDSLRTVIQMYPNLYHVVTLKKYPITKLTDIKGKKVSVGAPGSGTEYKTNLVLPVIGIKYADFKVYRLSFAENATQMKDGIIDVGIWSVAPPTSSIIDLATTHDIRFIPFSKEEVTKVEKAYPYYSEWVIPKNTYKGQTEDVLTIAVWNSVVCNKDLPDDLVYKITKAIFENKKMLVDTHKIAEFTTAKASATKSPIPVHPGALKYYKEIGVIK